jgi:hypothetical protein
MVAGQGSEKRGSVNTALSVRELRKAFKSSRSTFVIVNPEMNELLSGLSLPTPAFEPLVMVRPPAA